MDNFVLLCFGTKKKMHTHDFYEISIFHSRPIRSSFHLLPSFSLLLCLLCHVGVVVGFRVIESFTCNGDGFVCWRTYTFRTNFSGFLFILFCYVLFYFVLYLIYSCIFFFPFNSMLGCVCFVFFFLDCSAWI